MCIIMYFVTNVWKQHTSNLFYVSFNRDSSFKLYLCFMCFSSFCLSVILFYSDVFIFILSSHYIFIIIP